MNDEDRDIQIRQRARSALLFTAAALAVAAVAAAIDAQTGLAAQLASAVLFLVVLRARVPRP